MIPVQDDRITQEAAHWFMELQAAGPAAHAQFAQWLRRSPEHVEEFLAISGVSRRLDSVDPQRRIDVQALLAGDGAEIIRLLPVQAVPQSPQTNKRRRTAAGLAAACALGAVAVWQWQIHAPDTYTTRIGEQRAFKLADGSLVQLNTRSRAQVHFSAKAREVRLLEGEALFTVERDSDRPFRVISGNTTVQALGTQFNVYRLPGGTTRVAVIEGAVRVGSLRLAAGEEARARGTRVARQTRADIPTAIAWRERRLIFRDKPLSEVVAEFNRYNTLQFEVDEAAGREPLSGAFAADRPESLVLFLKKDQSIQVEKQGGRLLIKAKRFSMAQDPFDMGATPRRPGKQ